jgi:hypothetical protein
LYDLTLAPRYTALCGYMQAELGHYFAPFLPTLEQMKDWYKWI